MDGKKFFCKNRMLLFLMCISVTASVHITNLKVPATYTIENKDNVEPLILDCEYDIKPNETGFVLKWLLDNKQIYQWIPGHKPYPLGMMKSHIDIGFSLSKDKWYLYRALSIVNPIWNMTGEYTCTVQSFQSSDRKSSHLQIIVPETEFQLTAKVDISSKNVKIVCYVKDVYPQPNLSLRFNEDNTLLNNIDTRIGENHLYSAIVAAEVPRNEFKSPTPINCFLVLPGTNYTRRRETIFYDQEITTILPNNIGIPNTVSRLEVMSKDSGLSIKIRSITLMIINIILLIGIS